MRVKILGLTIGILFLISLVAAGGLFFLNLNSRSCPTIIQYPIEIIQKYNVWEVGISPDNDIRDILCLLHIKPDGAILEKGIVPTA